MDERVNEAEELVPRQIVPEETHLDRLKLEIASRIMGGALGEGVRLREAATTALKAAGVLIEEYLRTLTAE